MRIAIALLLLTGCTRVLVQPVSCPAYVPASPKPPGQYHGLVPGEGDSDTWEHSDRFKTKTEGK